MVSTEQLKDVLHVDGLTKRNQLLVVLACDGTPKQVARIKELAFGAGLRKAKSWNVSLELQRTKGHSPARC